MRCRSGCPGPLNPPSPSSSLSSPSFRRPPSPGVQSSSHHAGWFLCHAQAVSDRGSASRAGARCGFLMRGRCDFLLAEPHVPGGGRHSSAIPDGTLRLFRRTSNRRSVWNADGVGACETVCSFSDNSFAGRPNPSAPTLEPSRLTGFVSLRCGPRAAEPFWNRTLQRKSEVLEKKWLLDSTWLSGQNLVLHPAGIGFVN